MKTVNKTLGLLIETVEYDQQVMDMVMKRVNNILYLEDDHTFKLHVGKHGISHVERFLSERGWLSERQPKSPKSVYKGFTEYSMIGGCILILLVNPEIGLIEEEISLPTK